MVWCLRPHSCGLVDPWHMISPRCSTRALDPGAQRRRSAAEGLALAAAATDIGGDVVALGTLAQKAGGTWALEEPLDVEKGSSMLLRLVKT